MYNSYSISRIIYISSISAFKGCKSVHGKIKLEIESLTKKYNGIIIRPGLIYSKKVEGAMFGSLINLTKKIPIIPLIDNGNQILYMCELETLCKLIHQTSNKNNKNNFILAANKIDDISHEKDIFSLYELGMGDPMPVSAQSGRSLGNLLDEIHARLPERAAKKKIGDDVVNLAIIGMPNVGKSSLMNNLLKEEKSIVTDIAGTTRDAVDSYLKHFE